MGVGLLFSWVDGVHLAISGRGDSPRWVFYDAVECDEFGYDQFSPGFLLFMTTG